MQFRMAVTVRVTTVLVAMTISADTLFAGAGTTLQPGAYEVQVRLELPNLADMTASKIARICIGDPVDAEANQGLAVLSDNNPLAKCPSSNLHADRNEIFFDIQCPGGNAARASARFTLADASFEGRITMKMGGKNMTMTETQSGRRVGDCATIDPK